jgi:hypothetical protein
MNYKFILNARFLWIFFWLMIFSWTWFYIHGIFHFENDNSNFTLLHYHLEQTCHHIHWTNHNTLLNYANLNLCNMDKWMTKDTINLSYHKTKISIKLTNFLNLIQYTPKLTMQYLIIQTYKWTSLIPKLIKGISNICHGYFLHFNGNLLLSQLTSCPPIKHVIV